MPTGGQDKPRLHGRPDGVPWHPAATALWDAIWDSPMATEYDASDAHGMLRLLDLVHEYWSVDPQAKGAARLKVLLAAEIRLEQQNFGLSPLDRRRLQWEIERAEQAKDTGRSRRRAVGAGVADPRVSN